MGVDRDQEEKNAKESELEEERELHRKHRAGEGPPLTHKEDREEKTEEDSESEEQESA